MIAKQTTPGVQMRNEEAAIITEYDIKAFDLRQGALTTVTVEWENTQIYPVDTSLIIKYDSSQIYSKLENNQSSSPCLFRQATFVTCQFYDDFIMVEDLLTVQ
jgi:hypothetical protein